MRAGEGLDGRGEAWGGSRCGAGVAPERRDPGAGGRPRGGGRGLPWLWALCGAGGIPPGRAAGASSVPSVGQARGEPGRGRAGGLWCPRWAPGPGVGSSRLGWGPCTGTRCSRPRPEVSVVLLLALGLPSLASVF